MMGCTDTVVLAVGYYQGVAVGTPLTIQFQTQKNRVAVSGTAVRLFKLLEF